MRVTEQPNPASLSLDQKSSLQIVRIIHREDSKVPNAVGRVLPQVARAVDVIAKALAQGGRLVYLGAGTSGRLGVLDAAECIPTFGTDRIVGVMAGAPQALFRPSETSEDLPRQAVRDLRRIHLHARDVLVGISASGRTPYVLGGMRHAHRKGAFVIALTCNPKAPIRRLADISIVPVTGPEVIAGSTRMKAATAQKMVLNMLSSASMVRRGRVLSNYMIGVQMTNRKLRERGCGILVNVSGCSRRTALKTLKESGGRLPVALLMLLAKITREAAERRLQQASSPAAEIRAAQADEILSKRRKVAH